MFAKLKKKLEDENQVDLSNVGPSNLQRSESKQILFSKSKDGEQQLDESYGSTSSTSNYGTMDNLIKTRSQDDLPSLQTRTDRVHRLETRLKEYVTELSLNIEKRKELEEQFKTREAEMMDQRDAVEKEWQSKFSNLEAENKKLQEKVQLAEIFKNKYVENQDAIDELEGLQTQEMAKIKHMLLNCQQELQQSNTMLSSVETELEQTKKKLATVESRRDLLEKQLNTVETERLQLKEQEINNKRIVEDADSVKNTLENEVDSLKTELLQLSNRAKQAEETVNSLQDENAAVRHTHEMYCKQSILIIEGKDAELDHLQERVALLEQRAANCDLDDDLRMLAVIAERNTFEMKVEESRQQLNEIKSTWSGKIMNLERQISHLNEKISEDNEEHNRIQKGNLQVRIALEEKLTIAEENLETANRDLKAATESLTTRNCELQSELAAHVTEMERLKEVHSALIDKLNEKIKQIETEKCSVEEAKAQLEESLLAKVKDLKAAVATKTKHENSLESSVHELQSKLKNLEDNLAAENTSVKELTKRLQCGDDLNSQLKIEVDNLKKSETDMISQIESLKQLCAQKDDELLQKNRENKEHQHKSQEANERLEELRKSSTEEINHLSSSVSQLEASLTALKAESSELMQQKETFEESRKRNEDLCSQLDTLNESVLKQANEISDKNKTIRLQQQRILDMKKTLQRELKLHSMPFEGSNGETPFDQDVAGSHNGQKENQNNVDLMQHLQTFEARDLTEDVNFRYLKHVVLKFMTSREYEAQHLIRAVSVLLHFTQDEERLIKDTLDWKMSWFRSKPEYGKGQMSKTIPIT